MYFEQTQSPLGHKLGGIVNLSLQPKRKILILEKFIKIYATFEFYYTKQF